MNTSWSRFHEGLTKCLKQTGRQIVQSVESCDDPSSCGQWVTKVANLWRTGGDVQNYWGSIMHNAHTNDKMQNIAIPGHFNDADMLQVGNVGLTPDEQKAHFSLVRPSARCVLLSTAPHSTIIRWPLVLHPTCDAPCSGASCLARSWRGLTSSTPRRPRWPS